MISLLCNTKVCVVSMEYCLCLKINCEKKFFSKLHKKLHMTTFPININFQTFKEIMLKLINKSKKYCK